MKKLAIVLLCVLFLITIGCASNRERGAVGGAAAGALLGAAAFGSSSWQAALIGALGGAIIGGLVGDAMDSKEKAQQEAVKNNQRVVYYDDHNKAVEAIPSGHPHDHMNTKGEITQTDCRKVTTNVYEGGKLVSSNTEEVCTGTKSSNTY